MAVKATGGVGTGTATATIVPLSPTEVEVIQKKIAEFVKDGAIFFGVDCDKKFDFLSGWYPCPIEYGKIKYSNADAAVEAQRFTYHPALMREIAALNSAEAMDVSRKNRDSGNPINEEAVTEVVSRVKFSQNDDLKKLLLSTGNAYIALSGYTADNRWSDGFNCMGQNKFGCILMQVRGGYGGRGEVVKPNNLHQIKEKQLVVKSYGY